MYLNAGGVTVSYFEWLKNLSHVRFGRMEKRYEEMSAARMVKSIESATGKSLSDDASASSSSTARPRRTSSTRGSRRR